MPFVARKLEPRLVCRGHVPAGGTADWPVGAELEAVANGALTASLKQLASLLGAAEDVFGELTRQLAGIAERSDRLRGRISGLEERLAAQDPKKIPVPESDICTFAARTEHFKAKQHEPSLRLFTLDTRPTALRQMYEAAASIALRSLDSLRRDRDAISPIDMFICTPVMSKRRRDQSLDIEARRPRAIEQLRRWTSAEALGDVTVAPDCASRIFSDESADDSRPVDHKLPSPEEQLQAVALKFPAELVAVDISGRGFHRMSMRRRSLHHEPAAEASGVRRRSRPRRPRGKRRNTIAGTDRNEIRQAVAGESTEPEEAPRSASTDLLDSQKSSPPEKKSHFNTLKAWGRSRLKLISAKSTQQNHTNESTSSLANIATSRQQVQLQQDELRSADESPAIATSASRRSRRESSKSHERKPSSSSSSGKSTNSSMQPQLANGKAIGEQPSDKLTTQQLQQQQQHQQQTSSLGSKRDSVRLRESAAERRERRKARADEPPHSSSGNWSASSESGRASIGSETTTTTHPPSSTTTASIGTSSTSLSHARRLKSCRDTSASSSVTSEGTLTPDIIQDINAVPFSDDGETSSVYSCDTEGYYTSFHVDSGLKTLREEEPAPPQSPLTRSNEVHSDPTSPIVENEYELYGRGSTSTTTSSAGTVCTTLLAPPPPERKSSLTVVAMVHGQKQNGGESPDSGHNTSSSPVESASSPAFTGRSCSEFEYSESSDLEGCERIERIRSKTAINTSRIPSMCVITPPNSDDEHTHTKDSGNEHKQKKRDRNTGPGSVLMSATVATSKMEVINGQDTNLYATVQTVTASNHANSTDKGTTQNPNKISPLSGVLGKLRGVLPGRKQQQHKSYQDDNQPQQSMQPDSGDYVTIADVRNNNSSKRRQENAINTTPVRSNAVTYANSDLFRRDAEYVSLSELPKKPDSSLERRRQGARVTLDSEGKVVYSSDSLKRRKGAHTTFIPGPFVKEGNSSPAQSPLLRRANVTPRAVTRTTGTVDSVDGESKVPERDEVAAQQQQQQQPGKVIIRAAKSPERAASPDYVRTPATVVGPTTTATAACSTQNRQSQRHGAYVNVQGGDGSEDQALLTIQPSEQVSTATCPPKQRQPPHPHPLQQQQQQQQQAPPPYVGPPQVHKFHEVACDKRTHQEQLHSQLRQSLPTSNNSHHHQQQHILVYDKHSSNKQNVYAPQPSTHCPRSSQFYTLPNRRPQRDVELEPARSITPDITRGLARGPLSSMHMLARHGQNSSSPQKLAYQQQQQQQQQPPIDLNRRNLEQLEISKCKQRQATTDVRNRFASPVGLSAVGYRLFASPIQDGLKSAPISPIGPEQANGFRSSTPTSRATPTVAERLALQSQRCASPNPALVHSHVPANIVLSPSKTTMSNEELFAAIHKSKRRLNIRDGSTESLSPADSLTSLNSNNQQQQQQHIIGTRHSWSPESQKVPEIPKSVPAPSATSRMDFKRLLLQQSIKSGPIRVSAAEQLKLSRQQCQEQQLQQQLAPKLPPQTPQKTQQQQQQLAKVLSPRSAWRFQTPRTDVLSSTIIEDAAAEEKAMKPSPETPTGEHASRRGPAPSSRRQLDLEPAPAKSIEQLKNRINDSKSQQRSLEKRDKELENRLQLIDAKASQADDPIKAIENRRISNQLARAQFLASSSPAPATKDLFNKRFRARSESPQQNNAQREKANGRIADNDHADNAVVTRSPSAPALETAL